MREEKRRSVRLPRPPLNSAKNRFLSMPVFSATAASSSLFFFMYFLGIFPESVAYLTLRYILPIARATIHVMLFKNIIRHLPIILQVLNGTRKGAVMAVTMADSVETIVLSATPTCDFADEQAERTSVAVSKVIIIEESCFFISYSPFLFFL